MADIVGKRIVEVRAATDAELEREGWESDDYRRPVVLVLENGVILYPSSDEEGNAPGALFGTDLHWERGAAPRSPATTFVVIAPPPSVPARQAPRRGNK